MPRKKVTKIKCPDCDAEYPTGKGLSSHRRSAHGYVSDSKWAIKVRKKREEQKGDIVTILATREPLRCDQCDFLAANTSALTWHKARQHSTHKELRCDQCGFLAKWPGGLTYHKRKSHPEANPTPEKIATFNRTKRRTIVIPKETKAITIQAADVSTSNGHHRQESHPHPAPDGIPEGTLALALGRFQELCRSIAVEHDLPPRMFASRLAGLIYATTLR